MPVTQVGCKWSSGDMVFTNKSGSATIHYGATGDGIDVKFWGNTSAAYMLWDESADALIFDKADIQLGDTDFLRFGDATGGDVNINWTGAVLAILPAAADTGAINVGNGTADIDVKIFLGSTTEFVDFNVGDSSVYFGGNGKGVDVVLYGETTGKYLMWDQSADKLILEGEILLSGALNIGIDGTGHDVTFYGDTASYRVLWDQNGDTNGAWFFGQDDYGIDVSFYGQAASHQVTWDASGDTGAGIWSFGQDDHGVDVVMYGETAGKYAKWDMSADTLIISGATTLGGTVTIGGGQTVQGAGAGSDGFILKNLKNDAIAFMTGAGRTVEIDIGGTAYYFVVHPTAA